MTASCESEMKKAAHKDRLASFSFGAAYAAADFGWPAAVFTLL